MTFILRWLLILVLLVFIAFSLFPAAIVTLLQSNVNIPGLSSEQVEIAGNSNWIETALWYGAAVFLFIATVRLIRRTQAFVTWLIGFLLYGGRWALTLQDQGGVMPAVQALTVDSFRPENITTTSTPGQLALLAALLVVGIVIFIVDHTDRKHWAAQAA